VKSPSLHDLTFFPTPAAWRRWLQRHHARTAELWVGFHKRTTGRPSITWPQSVDEALCFGWIDGIRKRIDAEVYAIRFTPRRKDSTWSLVNIRRVKELTRQGLMRAAGIEAFRARRPERSGVYSFENAPRKLAPPYLRRLKANAAAWSYFRKRPPGYQRLGALYVMSAKREETRLRRLAVLIRESAAQRDIGMGTRVGDDTTR
jgi:uncharacterized protein YdeI (YjbR/CyaY-like superfamily)